MTCDKKSEQSFKICNDVTCDKKGEESYKIFTEQAFKIFNFVTWSTVRRVSVK